MNINMLLVEHRDVANECCFLLNPLEQDFLLLIISILASIYLCFSGSSASSFYS